MQPYGDIDRDSGVRRFQIGSDYLEVEFKDGKSYRYTYATAGSFHIERMKELALRGEGLNAYINDHVRKRYQR